MFKTERFNHLTFYCWGKPQKRALLFFHGFMGNGLEWERTISGLEGAYYSISVDLPGHGKSQFKEAHNNFEAFTHTVTEFLSVQKVETVILVGYSLGGRLALQFAHLWPQKVASLILESASPGLQGKEERNARLLHDKNMADKILTPPFSYFLEQWYKQPVFKTINARPGYAQMLKDKQKNNPQNLSHVLKAFSVAQQPNFESILILNKMPVLLICGAEDAKYASSYRALKYQNPSLLLNIVPGCSHNVHFEAPAYFDGIVTDFITKNM